MRFHCLGLPHTVTSHEYVACAYTQKVLKFCKMMRARGHYIIHYGHEESQVDADEHVTVLTNKDLEIAYGTYDWRKNFFKFDTGDHAYTTFYKNAIEEVGKRKKPNDFILPFWGSGTRPVCDAHPDVICVEPGIGYAGGHWAKYKIFESYAIYHAYCGMQSVGSCRQSWYEAVIPNYFDPDDFEYCEEKDDYFLFLGRVYDGKGIHTALQATQKIGAKLIIAGQNSLKANGIDPPPPHVVEYGYADREARKKLMAKAKGAFVASNYLEPFGGVQVEMLLSGTPTITTDWGSFTENNIHGVTGYRCRTMEQFCWAAKNIDKIKPADCRKWAMNFSLDKVAGMYEEYFQMVLNVHTGGGWYETFPYRPSLDWLDKTGKEPTMGDIFMKHKTDKLNNEHEGHNYNIKYEELFGELRHKKIKIFEMGIGSIKPGQQSGMEHYLHTGYKPGASHRAWKEYFSHPETEVLGADIDDTLCDEKQFFHVDQFDRSSLKNVANKIGKCDIIIDDGCHEKVPAQNTFMELWDCVKPGGYYIVEDVKDANWIDHSLKEVWEMPKRDGNIRDNRLLIFKKPEPVLCIGPALSKEEFNQITTQYSKYIICANSLEYIDYYGIQYDKIIFYNTFASGNVEEKFNPEKMMDYQNKGVLFYKIDGNIRNKNFSIFNEKHFQNKINFIKVNKWNNEMNEVLDKHKYKSKYGWPSTGFMTIFNVRKEFENVEFKGFTFYDKSKPYYAIDTQIKMPIDHDHDFEHERTILFGKKPQIAIWSEDAWAFGRIHNDIIETMKDTYDFKIYDWRYSEPNQILWNQEKWKEYDVILGNSAIAWHQKERGWMKEIPKEYLDKCLPVFHHSLIDNKAFHEKIVHKVGPKYCGITPQVVQNIKNTYDINAQLTPIGVNTDIFYPTRTISKIKKAGLIGKPLNNEHIKRSKVFEEICEKAGIEPVFIHSRDYKEGGKLYDDIDLLMYTSTAEGVATGILEAGACNIPVITTRVGASLYLKNIKTFDTADEAVEIIKYFNENSNKLEEYGKELGEEIRRDWNWKIVCEKYWKPAIESVINPNIPIPKNKTVPVPKIKSFIENAPIPKYRCVTLQNIVV